MLKQYSTFENMRIFCSSSRTRDGFFKVFIEKENSLSELGIDMPDMKIMKNEDFDETDLQSILDFLLKNKESISEFAASLRKKL